MSEKDKKWAPIAREIVNPPPEALIKCPHCGAARQSQWECLGTQRGIVRRRCRVCGVKVQISPDFQKIRVI